MALQPHCHPGDHAAHRVVPAAAVQRVLRRPRHGRHTVEVPRHHHAGLADRDPRPRGRRPRPAVLPRALGLALLLGPVRGACRLLRLRRLDHRPPCNTPHTVQRTLRTRRSHCNLRSYCAPSLLPITPETQNVPPQRPLSTCPILHRHRSPHMHRCTAPLPFDSQTSSPFLSHSPAARP